MSTKTKKVEVEQTKEIYSFTREQAEERIKTLEKQQEEISKMANAQISQIDGVIASLKMIMDGSLFLSPKEQQDGVPENGEVSKGTN